MHLAKDVQRHEVLRQFGRYLNKVQGLATVLDSSTKDFED